MTEAQTRLYWREWALARDWFRAHGRSPSQADEQRYVLHHRALGRGCSSKDLKNAELDKVLAAFRAIHDGANLNAQLAAEDQPAMRRQALLANVRDLATRCVDRSGKEKAYLDGLSNKVFTVLTYEHLAEGQLQQLRGILERRIIQMKKASMRTRSRPHAVGGNPF